MSVGFFFSIGCLHTGQFFRHIPQICHSINAPSGNGCGQFQLRNHGEEPFSLFEGHKQRERSSLGQDRSRKTVKGRGILGGHASFDRGVRRELENLFLSPSSQDLCLMSSPAGLLPFFPLA